MTARKTDSSAKPATAKKTPSAKPATKSPDTAKATKPPTEAVAKSAGVAKVAKVVKPKKVRLIRDSFTMPSSDYALIDTLKLNALKGKVAVKKSELLRAGLHALAKLDSGQLVALVGTLAIVKTGRPKK